MPNNIPAFAVDAIRLTSSCGIGSVSDTLATAEAIPPSTRIYPVLITSTGASKSWEAASTCAPIRYLGFLPDMSERKRIPSASVFICEIPPGNMMSGMRVLAFRRSTT